MSQLRVHGRSSLVLIGGAAAVIGFLSFWVMARADLPAPTESVPIESASRPEKAVLLFIDSLRFDVATDPDVMPALVELSKGGTTFEVEPCRDRLTYLCLRAAFTGRDESSLLSIAPNFRRGAEHQGESLFSELASAGHRIVGIGSYDVGRYQADFAEFQELDVGQETVDAIAKGWSFDGPNATRVVVLGLMRGDSESHVHAFGSTPYRQVWLDIDGIVAAVAAATPPDAHLIVFGDHGHDDIGRHLPGLDCPTFALYRGPAIGAAASRPLDMTDHRALLGVLLGLPTPPTYGGPPLHTIFKPEWIAATYGAAPPVTGSSPPAMPRSARLGVLAALMAVGGGLLWTLGGRSLLPVTIWATATGLAFDPIRLVIHNQGDSPERALFLLVPLAAGVGWDRITNGGLNLPRLAGAILLAPLLLLFPSPNYYGSGRAVVLASLIAVALLAFAVGRACRATGRGQTRTVALTAGAVALLLVTFVDVTRQAAGELSTYDFSSVVYRAHSAVVLPILAGALAWLVESATAPRVRWIRVTATAGCSAVLALTGLAESPWSLPLALAPLVGALFVRRAPAWTVLGIVAALLLLYPLSRVAGIVGIATCLALVQRLLALGAGVGVVSPRSLALPFAVAAYLLLWPVIGFRLAGIDFTFMFRWITAAGYDRAWVLITVATVLKFLLPFGLLLLAARGSLRDALAIPVLPIKVALVATFGLGYAVLRPATSQFAMDVLSEIGLLTLVVLLLTLVTAAVTRRATGSAA